jgi:signal transduction histidine kinase/DNA-binding response OmpR family regulator/ligand-binding sensor domain-containing protein
MECAGGSTDRFLFRKVITYCKGKRCNAPVRWWLIFCCLLAGQSIQAVYFKHIGMNEGLSQTSVMSIYQDSLGRMWFGTREGISLYNGDQMRIFKNFGKESRDSRMNSLLGRQCESITGNGKGDVFFRTSGSMVRYDLRTERFYEVCSDINTLASDNGTVWVACDNVLYTYDEKGDSLRLFRKTNLTDIQSLHIAGERIWVGTSDGLYLIKGTDEPDCVLDGIFVNRILESSSGEVWVGTYTEGLYRIMQDGRIRHYTEDTPAPHRILSNRIREFAEDRHGNIWFGTFLGLQMYNPCTGVISSYQHDYLPGSLSHTSVFALFIDNQETVWVGTYYGGVNYFNPEKEIFTHYISNPARKDCLNHPFVGHIAEDRDGNIWICTEGGGLNLLNRQTRTFTCYVAGKGNALLQNNLKAIAYDKKRHCLYIGAHFGGLSRYDISAGVFHNYLDHFTDKQSMPYQIINHILMYGDSVYISSMNGVFSLDPDTGEFRYICEATKPFTIDADGNIWIAGIDRLIRINLSDTCQRKEYSFSDHNILFEISHILKTGDGRLYFVTLGSGLYRYDAATDSFTHYTEADGALLSDYCYCLAETNTGELLITSDKGITFFNPGTKEAGHYKLRSHLPISSITDGCGILVCRNNELFIGGSDGLASFWQDDLYKKEKDYSLYFSELYIHNTRVCPGSSDRVLNEILPYTESITLKHDQNNLIINFASTNYIDIQKNIEYEYRLEGFDREWAPTSLTHIYYTNLNPGNYKLTVREKTPPVSSLRKKEISLDIIIRTPWYNTVWAWLFYLLTALLIALVIFRTLYARRKLTLSLEREREEKERNEELNQAKLRFFTSISHEFRTPLTLIIGQIDSIFQHTTLSPTVYNKIIKIYKNANRLRNMITELLEFRKLEQQYVSLKVSEQDLVPFLKDIYLSYHELAARHHIIFNFHPDAGSVRVWFDPAQLQKVFNNLLSNAFKYTKENGTVEIFIDETDHNVSVKVIDNGIGISREDASHIFERFYQAARGQKMPDAGTGTGIGLALSKNIVTLHHGEISVQSEPGYGSIFTVTLQKGKEHFEQDGKSILLNEPEEPMIQADSLHGIASLHYPEEPDQIFPGMEKGSRYTVLIVEDNEELLQLLNRLFEPLYKVLLARNGEEGLQTAQTDKPDLIVSDVMMPVMSGIEMCHKIKNNIELCHIPVVLLTALDTVEHNLEGLQQGADDYISKPFHAKILLIRCNNLIKNRLLIKNQLSKQIDFDVQLLTTSPLDQKFMRQVSEIVDKYIDDTEFEVSTLARELYMGRSTLFTKFKSLTGMTPNEFVRNQRIKRAAVMLREHPDMQITEVSERIGFTSPVYFSRCFKIQFGVSPQQFRKNA